MNQIRLLIVDDDRAVCDLLAQMLDPLGYEIEVETNPHRVMAILTDRDFDALLLDMVMPGLSGMELLELVRQRFNVLPVVVVSGYGSNEMTIEAMRRGASDFVVKPVEAELLDLRIRRAIDLEHARRLANTDGLTGLYNHRYFQERLEEEIDRAMRYDRPLSLIMADLDHFKSYNDAYGHPIGDEVLIEVANTLRRVSRASDVVARYGGEEFAVVLPETHEDEAVVVAERARECVEALEFAWQRAGAPSGLTVSLGVASLTRCSNKADLISHADRALYTAKRSGKNRVSRCEVDPEDTHPLIESIQPGEPLSSS